MSHVDDRIDEARGTPVYVEVGCALGACRDTGVFPATTAASNGSRFGPGRSGRGRRSDQPTRPYKLKMIDPATSQVFPLSEEVTIGRAPGCSVPLADDTFVSQLHARIYIRDGKPFVEDLGSTNGTFLNRDRLSKTMPLHRGDKLQIGQTVLEIVQ